MKNLVFLAILLIASAFVGCHRQSDGSLTSYKWAPVDPKSDTIVLELDMCWDQGLRDDTIETLLESLQRSMSQLKGRKKAEVDARLRFFKAMHSNWNGDYGQAVAQLDTADALCDSAAYPYTAIRISLLKHFIKEPSSAETFRLLLSALNYYQEIGDLQQQALAALLLSQSLNLPDEPGLTLHYFKMADSIYELLGNDNYHTKNRINEAYLLFNAGETEQSRAIFDELLVNPVINADQVALEMVLRNRTIFFNDTDAMRRAYRMVNPEEMASLSCPHSVRALYEGLLCEHFMKTGRRDSAAYYARLCADHIDELKVPRYESVATKKLADYYEAVGDDKNNLKWTGRYSRLTDSIVSSQGPGRKIYLQNLNTLRRFEFESETARRELRQRHYVIIASLAILLLVLLSGFMHWRQRQKLRTMRIRYEWECSRRKVMAMSLSQEEAHKVIDYVKQETSRLSREENISARDISEIERNLKIHQSGKEEMGAFEKAFSDIHPDFSKRLKDIAPSVSENNIRLCSYIVIGLSNRQIADLLNVRPGSIKQSRWRLRTKLNVPQDQTLEDFLRKLAE